MILWDVIHLVDSTIADTMNSVMREVIVIPADIIGLLEHVKDSTDMMTDSVLAADQSSQDFQDGSDLYLTSPKKLFTLKF